MDEMKDTSPGIAVSINALLACILCVVVFIFWSFMVFKWGVAEGVKLDREINKGFYIENYNDATNGFNDTKKGIKK